MARIKKGDIKVILECLAAGIPLEKPTPSGKTRRFVHGQITNEIERGALRTTHLTENLRGYVWLPEPAVAALAAQAREKLARKDEIKAQQAHGHAIAMGRD